MRRLPLNSLWNWNAITYWGQVLNINRKGQIPDFFFFLCIWGVFARRINYPEHTIILNWNAQIRQLVESFSGFFQKLIVALKHGSFLVFISNCKDAKEINKRSKSLKLYRMKYHNTYPKNIEWNTIIYAIRTGKNRQYVAWGKNYVTGNDYYKSSSCSFLLLEGWKYSLIGAHRGFH